MPDNKTTPADEAKAALLSSPYLPGDAYWIDLLQQEYATQRQASFDAEIPEQKRKRLAVAAICADMLSRYFQREGMNEEAGVWITRATRLHRIAFQRNNSIASTIGASMP